MAAKIPKEHSMMVYPRTLLTILASVGGLALFLMLASSILVSQPIGYAVRNYFYGVDNLQKVGVVTVVNESVVESSISSNVVGNVGLLNSTTLEKDRNEVDHGGSEKSGDQGLISKGDKVGKRNHDTGTSSESEQGESSVEPSYSSVSKNSTMQKSRKDENPVLPPDEISVASGGGSMNTVNSSASTNKTGADSTNPECDLYHGNWVHDSAGPLYTNNSCPVLTQMQNCQGNGRPDKDYENWRWKPKHCDLPRFDARKFLELMRGKTLAFIGDSVARNQMESMLCLLWQVEVPKNRGNRRMHRYYFRSTSTMIVRIWSSWLLHQTSEPYDSAPAGITKLHLDAPDEGFMELITGFDVIVLSSGHWFAKKSVYILNNEIVGGQLWRPNNSKQMKINSVEAFGISVETILTAMVTHPNYTGLTIVRSYSPDHYEGGAWNTGGSCTGKVRPATDSELAENGFTNTMHEKQVTGFDRAIKKKVNKSKLKLMDITQVFSYRHDGHPGPYRSPDPNKITKRGPNGKPPPQDCLHWCMPGPVDTWNEMVSEIIRREFEDRRIPSRE